MNRPTEQSDGTDRTSPDLLRGRVELLTEENQRLRAEVARAKQARYHRTALGLGLFGAVAGIGAILFTDIQEVLVTLTAIAVFSAFLVYYLTPEAVITAALGQRVYDATATNLATLADQLGLQDEAWYLPTDGDVSLYVPQQLDSPFPEPDAGPIVTMDDARGLLVTSIGSAILDDLADAMREPLADEPGPLAVQLADAVVELFELARTVEPEVTDQRVTFSIQQSTFSGVDRIDHPLVAVLGAGLATGLESPVTVAVQDGDEYADWLVTCRWDAPA